MAQTTKRYLDLEGLRYVLGKLAYTKPEGAGKFLTGLTEKNGIVGGTWADLAASDIPKLGTPTAYSAASAIDAATKVATFTHTITRDGEKADLTASVKLGVSGDLTMARAENGQITIGYKAAEVVHPVLGVKKNGYLTLGATDKLLDINSDKLAVADTAAGADGGLLTTKAYVDAQVNKAIAGGVQYKGTTTTIPANPANGDMYKVTADITTGEDGKTILAKDGDVIIYKTDGEAGSWDVIPSGNDIEYTGVIANDTTVIDATKGGDVTFVAGNGLTVAGAAGKVTYTHATPDGAAAKESGFYKVATDAFGHVTGTSAVAKEDITGLLGDTYQAKFSDGSAVIASVTDNVVTLKSGVKQTAGAIANDGTDITLAKVASTGKAADVTLDKITGLTAENVQAAISELNTAVADAKSAGVQSIDGKTGAIKLDTTSADAGSVKFAWATSDAQLLKATVTLPSADAKVVTADAELTKDTFTGDTFAKITIANVKETNGAIAADATDAVIMQTITANEIDALFKA